ncbi:hypothetical protein [Streptomyces vietnamensis]|uniref:Uncharacterized protein n=1 Tax=Streptomyces vietnamensis TaxID=362257 RepID=A0A0B5IL06_9ACTN|nr:hypothetical protein [Streptomyces vietnamensis]AJF70308.1 hypothetical protein SVTN_39450 [Streptomyces vietnamensis]
MPYVVALQFVPGGPRVTGTWNEEGPADRRFLTWLGLYGVPGAATVIALAERTPDGLERLIRRWPEPAA